MQTREETTTTHGAQSGGGMRERYCIAMTAQSVVQAPRTNEREDGVTELRVLLVH